MCVGGGLVRLEEMNTYFCLEVHLAIPSSLLLLANTFTQYFRASCKKVFSVTVDLWSAHLYVFTSTGIPAITLLGYLVLIFLRREA